VPAPRWLRKEGTTRPSCRASARRIGQCLGARSFATLARTCWLVCHEGRYQARYRGPDDKLRLAPSTFQRKTDAEVRRHLKRFVELKERGFVFIGPKGVQLRRSNFYRTGNKIRTSATVKRLSAEVACKRPATRWP
jgi:hypothetical protein